MYKIKNNFSVYEEGAHVPYGVIVEDCYELWHKHGRPLGNGYALSVGGNRFFLDAPVANVFSLRAKIGFNYVLDYAAISVILGYQMQSHTGYELCLEWLREEKRLQYTVITIKDERLSFGEPAYLDGVEFPDDGAELFVRATDEGVFFKVGETGEEVRLDLHLEKGAVGFQRPDAIGENVYIGEAVLYETELELPYTPKEVVAPVTVEIPMLNGGTMPYLMTYHLFDLEEKRYLEATLSGGTQERERYPYYRAEHTTGQYSVEQAELTGAYATYNGRKIKLREGKFGTADGDIHWKGLLDVYKGIIQLPLTMCVSVDKLPAKTFGFGYDEMKVSGFATQVGKAEFLYGIDGKYLGEVPTPDSAELISPKDKRAVQIIPKTVFEYEKVKAHFENNHYFAEDEEICFTLVCHTDKEYLSYDAQLQDVYGEKICGLEIDENLQMRHAPLPVGVYRVKANVYYGGEILTKLDVVFEVFDETGKKCAPIESGLPFTFSVPNEQRYLDRDVFDPWSPVRSCNAEHYVNCCAWTGDVGERKRVWEVIKLFGRSWYVWLETHRTMTDCYYEDHLDIVKNADYIYYPSDYEWGVLRSDYIWRGAWDMMPKTRELLDKFLDEREGAREKVGYERGGEVSYPMVHNLFLNYRKEWYDYANAARLENFAEQNEMLAKYNPNWKRACYGPFPPYGASMRSYKLTETMGSPSDERLSQIVFTGFCQFEDYPHSCAYQTYRGAFSAGTILLHTPDLKIYPEQYTGGGGGCTDGHVKYANPPFGRREFPKYFHTTHAREYVYNTACKTDGGYRFWDTYGFMKRDIPVHEHEQFVADWKYVLAHKPKKLHKSALIVAEVPDDEFVYDMEFVTNYGQHFLYNRSEEGIAYAYQVSRELGLPCGAFARWNTLLSVTEEEVDTLVLPSLRGVDEKIKAKIRELYHKGVNLIAVSYIDGLEDIFGVKFAPQTVVIRNLSNGEKTEPCYPFKDEALYESDGATVLMTASKVPAILRKGNAVLVNFPICSMGRTYFRQSANLGRITNSELLKEVFGGVLCQFSAQLVRGEKDCGVTLFEDEKGDTLVTVIDYSNYEIARQEIAEEKTIAINGGEYADAVCVDGKPLRRLIKNGTLCGVVVSLRAHESAMIKLIKK